MAFDLSSAKPVSVGFDISSAKPMDEPIKQTRNINPSLTETLFPRSDKSKSTDSLLKRSWDAAQDAYSLPGRALAAVPTLFHETTGEEAAGLAEQPETFAESMARTKGKERTGIKGKTAQIGGDILRHPVTAITAPIGVPAGLGYKGVAAAGAGIGALSGGLNQLTNVSEGKKVNFLELIGEILGGAAVPVAGKKTLDVAKAVYNKVKPAIVGQDPATLTKLIEEMAKKIPDGIDPKSIKDISLKEIKKGKDLQVMDRRGEVYDLKKPPKQGLLFSAMSEQERTALAKQKAPQTIPLQEYAGQSRVNIREGEALTPEELVGTNIVKAYKYIDDIRKDVGSNIENIVNQAPNARVSLIDTKNKFLNLIEKKLNATIDEDGNVIQIPAKKGEERFIKDQASIPIIQDVWNNLIDKPDIVSANGARDIKSQIYDAVKHDKTGVLRTTQKSSLLTSIFDEIYSDVDDKIINSLNNSQKDLGNKFHAENLKYKDLIDLEEMYSSAAGKEIPGQDITTKSASIAKRSLTSGANSGTKQLFAWVKKVTDGQFDLFQDTQYANIAMKYSGDKLQWQKASVMGGVGQAMPGKGIVNTINNMLEAANIAKTKMSGGTLESILNWYNKQQAKYETKGYKPDLAKQ